MAHPYGVRKKVDASGGTEITRYYAVPVSTGTTGTKELAEIIADRCTATRGDVRLVLDALSAVVKEQLKAGRRVYLDDIGYLWLSVSSEGFDAPEACTPSKVQAKRICFRADKELKEVLSEVEFVKEKTV